MIELTQPELDNRLLDAAERGNVRGIEMALEAGADIEAWTERSKFLDEELLTPLMVAAKNKRLDACLKLLEKGAEIDGRGSRNSTPLMIAALTDQPELCSKLIELKADIEAKNVSWETPLILAVSGHRDDAAITLIERNANVNAKDIFGNTPLLRNIPLIRNANAHDETVFKKLLEHGADPNQANEAGETPLIHAASNNYNGICQLLLEHGVDPNHASKSGHTALMSAATNVSDFNCQALLDYGAYTEAVDNAGKTALLKAAEADKHTPGLCLLRAGAEKKDHPKIKEWFNELEFDAILSFPSHIIPSRAVCFAEDRLRYAVLNACATEQFATRVAAPLIASKDPEDRKLFQDIWDKLPPYWQRTYAATHIAFVKAGGVKPILGHYTGAQRSGSTPSGSVGVA